MPKSPENQGTLVRSIGLTSAIVLIVSSVIGTGVFKKVAAMSAELQSPILVLIAWLLAGLISLAGTLSNAEVASMLADSGGEFVYFRKIYKNRESLRDFSLHFSQDSEESVYASCDLSSNSRQFCKSLLTSKIVRARATQRYFYFIFLTNFYELDNPVTLNGG